MIINTIPCDKELLVQQRERMNLNLLVGHKIETTRYSFLSCEENHWQKTSEADGGKGTHYTFILPEFYPQDEDKNKKLKIGNIQRWILWKQIIYKDMTKSSIYLKKPMHRFPAFPEESSHRNPHGSIPGLSNTPSLFMTWLAHHADGLALPCAWQASSGGQGQALS